MRPTPDRTFSREVSPQPEEGRRSPHPDNLALMYQGILTGIVRLQANRIKRATGNGVVQLHADDRDAIGDPDKFRQRMLTAVRDINRQARAAGYSPEDVRDAEFATVAFLDEVVLSLPDLANGSARAEWKRQTLAVELYGEARAGEVFFDKLESQLTGRRDSPHVADVLEVYLLCLLLGFEGRYGDMRGELASIADRLRRKVDGIRNADYRLAPNAVPEPLAPAPVETVRVEHWLEKWAIPLMVGAAVLLFLLLKLNLNWAANRIVNVMRG